MALDRIAVLAEVLAVGIVVFGVWQIWEPAAIIVAGLALFGLAQGLGG